MQRSVNPDVISAIFRQSIWSQIRFVLSEKDAGRKLVAEAEQLLAPELLRWTAEMREDDAGRRGRHRKLPETLEEASLRDLDAVRYRLFQSGLRPAPWTPLSNQEEAISASLQVMLSPKQPDRPRALVVSPCGTGKSLISFWADQRLQSDLTVFFAPGSELLNQTLRSWKTESFANGTDFSALCISSLLNSSVESLGGTLTTDSTQIEQFLSADIGRRKVIFCTYMSSEKLFDALRVVQRSGVMCMPGFVVYDEAHRLAGDRDKLFSQVLEAPELGTAKRLSMTGSPKIFTDPEKYSMLQGGAFGEVAFRMTFKEAVEKQLLTPFRLESDVVDIRNPAIEQTLKAARDKFGSFLSPDPIRLVAHAFVLKSTLERYPNIRKSAIYHRTIDESRDFTKIFNFMTEGLGWQTFHVDGKSRRQSSENLYHFRSPSTGVKILSNSDYLIEGHDIPEIGHVQFASSRTTGAPVIQIIGRAARKHQTKALSIASVPIIADSSVDDLATSVDDSLLRTVDLVKELQDEYSLLETNVTETSSTGSRAFDASQTSGLASQELIERIRQAQLPTRGLSDAQRLQALSKRLTALASKTTEFLGEPSGDLETFYKKAYLALRSAPFAQALNLPPLFEVEQWLFRGKTIQNFMTLFGASPVPRVELSEAAPNSVFTFQSYCQALEQLRMASTEFRSRVRTPQDLFMWSKKPQFSGFESLPDPPMNFPSDPVKAFQAEFSTLGGSEAWTRVLGTPPSSPDAMKRRSF